MKSSIMHPNVVDIFDPIRDNYNPGEAYLASMINYASNRPFDN